MNRDKLPVEIENNLLPEEKGKKYHMYYDFRKRTSGGFLDAMFLSAIMLTGLLWAFVWGLSLR
jgi:hypothetical protein